MKAVDPKRHFPQMEEEILEFWEKEDIFQRSLRQREGSPRFVFYDGPPFATGLPHFGHFVPSILKDVIPRYKSMRGYSVPRRWGWDTHGLPVEYEVEKTLGLSGKTAIEEWGIANFNHECRKTVMRYAHEWKKTIHRIGRWIDFDHAYKTLDIDFMESVWWVFKQLFEKNLIYRSYYVLPYSPSLGTPLSNFELNLGEYKEIDDPALTVCFEATDGDIFLAWTTTPWTLPTNLALAVGAEIVYNRVECEGKIYWLAKTRLEAVFPQGNYTILEECPGSVLAGRSYSPLFPYYAQEAQRGAFRIYTSSHVTTETGTGIVHMAPFGEEDYLLLKEQTKVKIPVPLDKQACFTDEIPDFKDLFVRDANKSIMSYLKKAGQIFHHENYRHRYPHCYRTGQALIYRPISSWFVRVEELKERLIKANRHISWYPEHLQEGRFGKWLQGARDWAISRNRFWGNPIPVWVCDKTGEFYCVSSIKELEKLSGQKIQDLHRPELDTITWPSPHGGTYRRVEEVLDCWFESGAMPYGQAHFPFDAEESFQLNFPADFIAEGLDQTRGWFYTLLILSVALFDQAPFKNVLVNGLVLARDGKKMSKSARNYTDPTTIIKTFGADALRLYLLMSPVVRAEDLRYDDQGVRDVLRNILIPFWNAYSFFVSYARIDNFQGNTSLDNEELLLDIDRWLLSCVESLNTDLIKLFDDYQLSRAIEKVIQFIDVLNNTYIRQNRRRFWKSENDQDKKAAYQTLYYVLKKFSTLIAPLVPFISEEIYQNLKNPLEPLSIHLLDYPCANKSWIHQDLELEFNHVRTTIALGRSLRSSYQIKNRQALACMWIVSSDETLLTMLKKYQKVLLEELNVKEVIFSNNEDNLITFSAKAHFKVLGQRLGPLVKDLAPLIAMLTHEQIKEFRQKGQIDLSFQGKIYSLDTESILIQRHEKEHTAFINEGLITLGFDTQISPDLILEGLARDIVRYVQNYRKEQNFLITDRIELFIFGSKTHKEALEAFQTYIQNETLCVIIHWEKTPQSQKIIIGNQEFFIHAQVSTL